MLNTPKTLFGILVGLCVISVLGCAAQPGAARLRTITVNGTGIVYVEPDAFSLRTDVSFRDKDLQNARKQVQITSKKLIEATKAFPLDPRRSHTVGLSIEPKTDYQTNKFLGYEVSQDFRFLLSDVSQAGQLTLAALNAGVVWINTEFVSSKEPELWPKAREKALLDARRKAKQMAAVLGMKLGPPLRIKNGDEGNDVYNLFDDSSNDGPPSQFEDRLNWIPPTRVKIEADVEVEFSIEPQ